MYRLLTLIIALTVTQLFAGPPSAGVIADDNLIAYSLSISDKQIIQAVDFDADIPVLYVAEVDKDTEIDVTSYSDVQAPIEKEREDKPPEVVIFNTWVYHHISMTKHYIEYLPKRIIGPP